MGILATLGCELAYLILKCRIWIEFVDFIYTKILELVAKLFSDPQAWEDLFTFSIARKIHLLSRMPQTLFSLQYGVDWYFCMGSSLTCALK